MKLYNKKIFLSYSSKDKKIADELDGWFSDKRVKLMRDSRDVDFKMSFKQQFPIILLSP